MTSIRLVGWKPGLQTVSLVLVVMKHTGASLIEAKGLVERLLDGNPVDLSFPDRKTCELFRTEAEGLGATAAPLDCKPQV
jgi:hypothetical protein